MTGSSDTAFCQSQCTLIQCSQQSSQDRRTKQPRYFVLILAHEALSLIFHRDGAPNVMVIDGANAQVEGEFRIKLRDAGCHYKQTEPHTQSSNMGEGAVREFKRA
jgi:hypothetical protein